MFVSLAFLNQSPGFLGKFFEWMHSSAAEQQVFGWIVSSVILGGGLTALFKGSKLLWRFFYTRHEQNADFVDVFGEYYLYHPPLILGINTIPRVTLLSIERGIFVPAKASQRETNDTRLLCQGKAAVSESFIQIDLKYTSDITHKNIILWHFQKKSHAAPRIGCGVMCCVNFHKEPYRVPVLVTENPLPRATVDEALALLAAETTVTREIRRRLFDLVKNAPPLSEDEEFEHLTTPCGPLDLSKKS